MNSIIKKIKTEASLSNEEALSLLSSDIDTIELLSAAYVPRKKYFEKDVRIHILNNSQNGYCPEDCHYCVQAKDSKVPIEKYTKKMRIKSFKRPKMPIKKGLFDIAWYFQAEDLQKSELSFYRM